MMETKQDKPTRKIWKMRLVRQLYESGYNQSDVLNLFRFLDWLLKLPKALESEFWQELRIYEEERSMPYVTSVERIGIEKGERSLISRQLNRKLNVLPIALQSQIDRLSLPQLENLGEALLDFGTIVDLETWLAQQSES